MKNRILLFILIGIPFVPAVFAGTGSVSFDEIMSKNPEAVACNARLDKKHEQQITDHRDSEIKKTPREISPK